MVRLQQRWEVTYRHFADFINGIEEVNAVLRDRGWVEYTPWVPLSGKANEVVLISDYPDFATYKEQEAAQYADADFMNPWRQTAEFVVQGSGVFEVLEAAPHLV
jgi:hypothetical protein